MQVTKPSNALANLFATLSEELTQICQQNGITTTPYVNRNLPYFTALPEPHQQAIVDDLSSYVVICQDTVKRGYSPKDSAQLLWSALKKMKLRPTSDLFSYIQDGDLIEVHNSDLVQIFRSLNFYEVCSYSIEELHCRPWPELFRRSRPIEYQLIEMASELIGGKHKKTVRFSIEPHIIEETSSGERRRLDAEVKYGAPLYDEDTHIVVATIVLEAGKLIKSATPLKAVSSVDSVITRPS